MFMDSRTVKQCLSVSFSAYIFDIEGKLSTQSVRFCTFFLPIEDVQIWNVGTIATLIFFSSLIVAKLP